MGELTQAEGYLLEQIRAGSAEGWSQLVDRYQGRLVAFARSKLRGSADAEDLVQETFMSFLKGLTSFRGQASLETYLFVILRRKIINWCRGKRSTVCLLQDVLQTDSQEDSGEAAGQIVGPDPTASWYARQAEAHELQRVALADALNSLINHYKQSLNFRDLQIVEMLFYCQLRNKDIAEIAGVSANHVALIKHRSLKQIHDSLSAQPRDVTSPEPPDVLLTQIWQEYRLSCLKRSTIGAYLLGTLEPAWHEYVAFHLDRLGCEFCRANLEDLRQQTADEGAHSFRDRILESTVGFLHKP